MSIPDFKVAAVKNLEVCWLIDPNAAKYVQIYQRVSSSWISKTGHVGQQKLKIFCLEMVLVMP